MLGAWFLTLLQTAIFVLLLSRLQLSRTHISCIQSHKQMFYIYYYSFIISSFGSDLIHKAIIH